MEREMEKTYNPALEADIYKAWEASGFFNPDTPLISHKSSVKGKNAKRFSMVLPPPNVTGVLHLGHAFEDTVQDILVRFHRMQGEKTLWVPGTDHAAIATQEKVEKEIYKKEGKSRHDLGREEFLNRVRRFAKESHDTIVKQVRAMGASLDWSREAFTLDDVRSAAVREAFTRMYDAGLIYRGGRIVNWDPKLQTTVSDEEIEWKEEKVPFYYFKYGPFEIGTARPETKFGDKYVVMHPKDKRYAKYKHGEQFTAEWINGPVKATIIKDEAIDMSFGTGVMTITPWHDATDFEIAERHKLDKEQIIDLRGKLLPIAGEFALKKITEARPLIAEKLKQKGLLVKTDESYVHRIATSSRGGGTIEPQILTQWFVAVNKKFKIPRSKIKGIRSGSTTTLKEILQKAIKGGQIDILPERFRKTYFHWIDNLRDWCISRQIWYGHRIPVWYCTGCGEPVINPEIKSRWFLTRHGETDWNKEKRHQGHTDIPLNDIGIEQAKVIAGRLKNEKIDLILTSDLIRARKTAEIIGEAIGAEIVVDKDLRERFQGDLEGKTDEEIAKYHFENPLALYDKSVAGGESYKDLEERVWGAFSRHGKEHGHKNILLISHGGALRTLIRRIRNLSVEEVIARDSVKNTEVVSIDLGKNACKKCGSHFFEQDTDTLDTWFSSGLWTFSTLGWPFGKAHGKPSKDFLEFHPTSVIAPGYEILFFWVARMILMSGVLLGDIPFSTVFLHGIVRDKQGRKFSKSLGNGIDPLVLIEKYGADALRMSLIIGAAPGNDVKFNEDQVRGYRNFATKLWNMARFVKLATSGEPIKKKIVLTAYDKKVFKDFFVVKTKTEKAIKEFRLHEAAEGLYHYVWHEVADKIIEEIKPRLQGSDEADRFAAETLIETLLLECITLLHPFMPYATEAIYQELYAQKKGDFLMMRAW